MGDPVVMSEQQLHALLDGVRKIFTEGNKSTPHAKAPEVSLNFTKCHSRFAGGKDEDVESFINAIGIYKDCLNITDADALKGLPMLLDGQAGTWFRGAQSLMKDWDDALKGLRHAFGKNLPPHKIFKELFAKQQGDQERTDKYVSTCRALLAQLPADYPALNEKIKLDMIYGLLNQGIRSKVPRDQIKNFDELITKARSVETDLAESGKRVAGEIPSTADGKQWKSKPNKCSFCRSYGHTQAECRKLAARQNRPEENNTKPNVETTTTTVRPSSVSCYGCGAAGYIRSQCPRCKAATSGAPQRNAVVSSVATEVLAADFGANAARPLLRISVENLTGLAYVDSGAGSSIAGYRLYKLLLSVDIPL